MKRLSISLVTGLIALGLLLPLNTNAMTYTVEGSITKIAIPQNIEGTTIKRCQDCEPEELREFSGTLTSTKCEQRTDAGFDALVCTHEYEDSGTHTIFYDGKGQTFENFSLNNSNVTSISDFNTIGKIYNIYIKYNTNLRSLNADIFSSDLNANFIHLENNNISQFEGNIQQLFNNKVQNKTVRIFLNNNQLTEIPENVRENRDNYTIKLSSSERLPKNGSEDYLVDLSNNLIKDLKIIEIDGRDASQFQSSYSFTDTTSYQFGRFGYSNNISPTSYDYQILQNGLSIDNTVGTTSDTGITFDTVLERGNYTFKVCVHDDPDNCKAINFGVDYEIDIDISSNPDDGGQTSSLDGIYFVWQREGHYPESLISGYVCTLTKDDVVKVSLTYPKNDPQFYNLDKSLIEDDPDGQYKFRVELLDNEGNQIKSEEITFKIKLNNTINIASPIGTQTTGDQSSEVNVNFDWNTSNPMFNSYNYYYDYYVTTGTSCSGTNIVFSDQSTNSHTTFNHLLGIGNYLLCISIYDSNHNIISGGNLSHPFSIDILPTVSIASPNVTNNPIRITWDSFLPSPYTFKNYTYTVQNGSDPAFTGGTLTQPNDNSFSLKNLRDGTYTVTVVMNYNNNLSVTGTNTFTINSSSEKFLNISITSDGENIIDGGNIIGNHSKNVPVTFSWNGGGSSILSGYSYKLTNTTTSNIISSGAKNIDDNLTLGTIPLQSGTYKFEVAMLDSDNVEFFDQETSFTIEIPSDLEISSPSAGLQTTKDITFRRSGFAEFEDHYGFQLYKVGNETPITGTNYTKETSFSLTNMMNGEYTFTVSLYDIYDEPIETRSRSFSIPDSQDLTINISDGQNSVTTLKSKTGIFSRGGESENFDSYSYSVEGTTFKNEHYYTGGTTKSTIGSFTLNDLSTGRYRFTVTMLDSGERPITGKYLDFNVVIPATLKITSHTDGAKITTSNATFTWTGYSDIFSGYEYKLTGQPANFTTSSSFTATLTNGNYTLTVKLYSGDNIVAQDSIDFKVDIPNTPTNPSTGGGGGGGGSSGKTHYNNNLKVSLGNSSPTTNERINLIVKIDDKYTGKVTFPKLQYYSPDTEKWIDIPVTSKNYVSDYGDEAKLGYVKFTSNDDGRIEVSQFIKFSKNGYYRIYVEDKDGYDEYVETYVSNKKSSTTNNTNTNVTTNNTTTNNNTNNNTNANSIIREYLPEIFEAKDTQEEVYVARSCKRYTITYSDSLNVYTSPNLNISEYFVSKDYFKRYIDSKNKYQSGCPTNVGWISTSYSDKSNDNSRYTAPNGKVYFITGRDGSYYSNELNKELKTPTSFRTVQELKYYIRDRNPLISMAALGPTN